MLRYRSRQIAVGVSSEGLRTANTQLLIVNAGSGNVVACGTINPIREVRQSAKRLQEPDVLTPEEVTALLEELPQPARTITLIAATTGMRRGELFGLKWEDVDIANRRVRIVRSIVDQVEGEPKTLGFRRPLPIPDQVAASLIAWREKAELMRHSTPTVTLGIYVQAVTQDKRNAQDKVVELYKLPRAA